jgi:hypothetical protein
VGLELPEGTALERTDAVAQRLEQILLADADVAAVFGTVGRDVRRFAQSDDATGLHTARFQVRLNEEAETDAAILRLHDPLVAAAPEGIVYVLGLSHALNIAFFTALAESGEAAPRLATLSSTTFDAQLGVAAKVAAENPDLYFEIQTLNDYGTESLAALLYAVERLRSVVRANDVEGFRSLMTRGKDYLTARGDRR